MGFSPRRTACVAQTAAAVFLARQPSSSPPERHGFSSAGAAVRHQGVRLFRFADSHVEVFSPDVLAAAWRARRRRAPTCLGARLCRQGVNSLADTCRLVFSGVPRSRLPAQFPEMLWPPRCSCLQDLQLGGGTVGAGGEALGAHAHGVSCIEFAFFFCREFSSVYCFFNCLFRLIAHLLMNLSCFSRIELQNEMLGTGRGAEPQPNLGEE